MPVARPIQSSRTAVESLRESEARFRLLVDAVPQIVWITDSAGRAEFLNRQWAVYTGSPLHGETAAEIAAAAVHPEDAALTMARFDEARRSGTPFVVEHRIRSASGDYRWFLVRAEPYRDPATGAIVRWFGASMDIHDSKVAEAALHASVARFRAVANLVPDLLWQSEPDGSVTWYNDRWYAYTGQRQGEATGFGWTEALHPHDRAAAREAYERAVADGSPLQWEHRIRSADGTYRWFLIRAAPVRDEHGRITQWFGTATDVQQQRVALDEVERRVAERTSALAQANAALAAEGVERAQAEAERNALRRQLSLAEEEERRRLSRELHDEAGQHLTALALGLQALSDVAPPGSEVDRRAQQLRVLAETLGRELHKVAVRLRPKALDDFGLEGALHSYAGEWTRHSGIRLAVHARAQTERLSAALESAVYRIVQEALSNVAKHSQARRAGIVVERRDGFVHVMIEDDGRGFEDAWMTANPARKGGLGLLGIRERVSLLGGTVEVESSLNGGTTLFIRLPIDGAESRRSAPAAEERRDD